MNRFPFTPRLEAESVMERTDLKPMIFLKGSAKTQRLHSMVVGKEGMLLHEEGNVISTISSF